MKEFDENIRIETDHLLLRFLEEGDAKAIFDNINHDKEVLKYYVTDYVEDFENFSLEKMIDLENNADIDALFKMTPYYYKTSREDQKKLENLQSLDTHGEFLIVTYKKANTLPNVDLTDTSSLWYNM